MKGGIIADGFVFLSKVFSIIYHLHRFELIYSYFDCMAFRSSVWNRIRQRSSALSPENWVNQSAEVTCEICSNSGAFLRCMHEGCKKCCHIDCALNAWGLAIFDDGNLKVECEYHFGTILFCNCQTEYDEAQPYVFCDSCCEWFHTKCVGFTDNKAANSDIFYCKSCKTLIKNGESVSPVIKQKNIAKDLLSSAQKSARDAIFYGLNPLITKVGDIVDQIKTSQSNNNKNVTNRISSIITEEMIADGIAFLRSPPYLEIISGKKRSANCVLPFDCICNIDDLIKEYYELLINYQDEMKKWRVDYENALSSTLNLMSDILIKHGVDVTTLVINTNRRNQLNQEDKLDSTSYVMEDSIYTTLKANAELLMKFVSVDGDAATVMSIKPSLFDTYTIIAKFIYSLFQGLDVSY